MCCVELLAPGARNELRQTDGRSLGGGNSRGGSGDRGGSLSEEGIPPGGGGGGTVPWFYALRTTSFKRIWTKVYEVSEVDVWQGKYQEILLPLACAQKQSLSFLSKKS